MARVLVFGVRDFAELAHFYLMHDSPHEVAAFCVSENYLPPARVFRGLPVVAFEEVEEVYSPDDYLFFAPMAPRKMNTVRESIYRQAKSKGYRFISYVSSRATVFPGAQIGENCFILEDNSLQPFTPIGNNVVLWSGNHIGHHGIIKDHVTLTSHVVLSGRCCVESFTFFGVNSTIRDGLTIAEGTMIAMGADITRSTESWSVYRGAPAVKQEGVNSKDVDM